MGMTYYRRFRMEFDLRSTPLAEPVLPPEYDWLAWQPGLVERHSRVKYGSFHTELDARVFRCLGNLSGCRRLMYEMSRQDHFVPAATWLIVGPEPTDSDDFAAQLLLGASEGAIQTVPSAQTATRLVDCGTIQGMKAASKLGAVQNVGILPDHRGCGLGRALVWKCLHGFKSAGVERVYLEVTAENEPAVRLYRSIGFRLVRTLYKAVEE